MTYIQAAGMGGTLRPWLVVIHSMEAPLRTGVARSIAQMFASNVATSAHECVGPDETIQCVPWNRKAWHVGPAANGCSLGIEQTGYAAYGRAQWTTADGLAQLTRVADVARAMCVQWGIAQRWATDAEIRAAAAGHGPGGICTHADITRVLGGTTHTDPGPNYPRDLLQAAVNGTGDTMAITKDDINDIWAHPTGGDNVQAQDRLIAIFDTVLAAYKDPAGDVAALRDRIADLNVRIAHTGVQLTPAGLDQVKAAIGTPQLTDAQVQSLAEQLGPALLNQLAPALFKLIQQQFAK
jgi:hypothetical protein